MSPERPEQVAGESGVALVAALLAVVILAGLAVVFTAVAVSSSHSSAFSRDHEIAIHVAEAGADEIVSRVNWQKDYVTTEGSEEDEHELDLADHPDEAAQRQWAIDLVADDDDLEPLVTGRSGEGFGIRPRDPDTGEAHDLIFGVSFVPDRDRPERVRVIRMTFQREFFQPNHGIQSCGDLTIRGSSTSVTGNLASIVANGAVSLKGASEDQVAQGITQFADEDCPEVEAEDIYPRAGPPHTCYDPADCAQVGGVDGNAVLWWDLCPDGTARKVGSTPCTGEVVYVEPSQGGPANNHRGWRFRTGGGQQPRWQTRNLQSGVFFVHEANARIEGSGTATATVIVHKNEDDNGRSGNLHMSGSSEVIPALEGILLVADRDLEMRGSSAGGGIDASGLIAVGEQADLAGTAAFAGPVYIRDDPHTTHSWVEDNEMRGNFTVNYNQEIDITLLGSIRITAWNELR
jgi:hypothetical protein